MSHAAVTFLLINVILTFILPLRWAPLPLLIGACYVPQGTDIEIGPFHFTVIRVLVAAAILRFMIRRERLSTEVNGLDWLMAVWAVWALISSMFHEEASSVFINRLGLIYNACGIYFILRICCQSIDDAVTLCRTTAILLLPLSVMIVCEKMTGYNIFSVLGGVLETSEVRDGRVRAQGPFAHSILAGTVGGACLPLMIGIWQQYKKTAIAGTVACFAIMFASTSSGPLMTGLFALGGLIMWHWRGQMRLVRWLVVIGYLALDLVMNAPAYYIIAHINLTGSSTSWHRAVLIETSFAHLSEWWFAGTDYTRHWMPYGVLWSPNHIDVTNHYLRMGVDGGLPLMFLFIAILAVGFSFVGKALRHGVHLSSDLRFMIWALGAALFSHAATFISVSYFDQSFMFIYLTLAMIGSIYSATILQEHEAAAEEQDEDILTDGVFSH